MDQLIPALYGKVLCGLLLYRVLHHKHDCGNFDCVSTMTWQQQEQAPFGKRIRGLGERVVVSYAHNGFGNQLYSHTFAYLIAKSLNASLYIEPIPANLYTDPAAPENTGEGLAIMDTIVPDEFKYYQLPVNSSHRSVCEQENFVWSLRPKEGRNKTYSSTSGKYLKQILADANPRCLKLIGYFQYNHFCYRRVRELWVQQLSKYGSHSSLFDPKDIAVYLRCHSHYHTHSKEYYENILKRTTFAKIWLFLSPTCSKYPRYFSLVKYFENDLAAVKWQHKGDADLIESFMHDFTGMMSAPRLILSPSSWAFWAGLFSNATEIHVDTKYHRNMGIDHPEYVYHMESKQLYYGSLQVVDKSSGEIDIVYQHTPSAEGNKMA